jgi:geranylgeranyl reductase family protein
VDATSLALDYGEEPFQLPAANLPAQTWDAVIVGAGPAGSAAAIELAARGYKVLVADRGEFPREKICGDGLTGNACNLLKRFGLYQDVLEAGCRSRGLSVFSPSGIEVRLPGDYLTVRRSILDVLVARKAVERGAVFVHGTVEEVATEEDGLVTVGFEGDGGRQQAKYCLLATGSRITLARGLGLVDQVRPSGVALRCYVRSSLPLDRLVVAYDRHLLPGYGWIFPVGNQEFNLGCGLFLSDLRVEKGRLNRAMQTFVEGFPLARDLLAAGKMISPVRGAALRSGLDLGRTPLSDRVLAIGEVVGTTSPYTGEGIGQAMQSGVTAAELVHSALATGQPGRLKGYGALLGKRIGPHHAGCQTAQKWLARPWLADLIARRAEKSPFLRDRIRAILQETENPGQVFSWRGLWRSLWF